MSDRSTDGVRVVAIVSFAICFAVFGLALAIFLMAASQEAREFLGNVAGIGAVATFIFLLAWGSAKGMRAS